MSRIAGTPVVALVSAALGGALGAACGGSRAEHAALVAPASDSAAPSAGVDSLTALAARQARDSAADQKVLDSLHRPHPPADTMQQHAAPTPPLKGEDVEREAVRLFGPEGRTAIGAAPTAAPTFDIDVTSFATNRRVLEYLEFFQGDSRDPVEICVSPLGPYAGMIREPPPASGGRETRDWVPKLIAGALIARRPERYGFQPEPLPPLVFDEITVPDATGLDVLARLADTSVTAMLELNPQFVRGVTPPGRSVVVRVPRGHGTSVAERFDSLPVTERITFVDHYVARRQTLSDIDRKSTR